MKSIVMFRLSLKLSYWLAKYFILVAFILIPGKIKSSYKAYSQQTIQSIPCSGNVHYWKNGKIKSCYLSKDYEIDGNLLPVDSELFLEENGNPSRCEISKEAKFYGLSLPPKTCVFFNRWGHKLSFWLKDDTRIQGYLIASSNDGIGNSLYTNGKLKAIWLADEEEINGVPCTSSNNPFRFGSQVTSLGTKRMVWFYENGNLQQAMLSRDITIQGHFFKKGDIIYFDQDGKVDLVSKKLE